MVVRLRHADEAVQYGLPIEAVLESQAAGTPRSRPGEPGPDQGRGVSSSTRPALLKISETAASTSVTLLKDGTILDAFRNAERRDAPDGRSAHHARQGAKGKRLHPGTAATIHGRGRNSTAGFLHGLSDERCSAPSRLGRSSISNCHSVKLESPALLLDAASLAERLMEGRAGVDFERFDLSPQTAVRHGTNHAASRRRIRVAVRKLEGL